MARMPRSNALASRDGRGRMRRHLCADRSRGVVGLVRDANARRPDPGAYVLDGTKTYISNAEKAKFFVVFAKTDPGANLKGAVSACLVPASQP